MKEILLFTSKDLIVTDKVSFKYLFAIKDAYKTYHEHTNGLWGYAWQDREDKNSGVVGFNLFKSTGLSMGGGIGGSTRMDEDIIESLPEKCSMLCTTEIADKLEQLLKDKVKILRIFSETPLSTS